MRPPIAACAAALLAVSACGCAPRLPRQEWRGAPEALRTLADRADAVRSVSGPCRVTVARRDGYLVSLDGAIAARVPGWLRLRAWKLGSAVFDLTVTPEGVWVARGDADASETAAWAGGEGGHIREVWGLLSGRFFAEPGATVVDVGGARFTVIRALGDDGGKVACEVDRATLTARSFTVSDSAGAERVRLNLDRYRMVSGVPWPLRFSVTIAPDAGSAGLGQGLARLTMTFDEVELNGEVPDAVFQPPQRAVRQVIAGEGRGRSDDGRD